MMKRFLSILLVAVMLLGIVPAASMAETQYATVVGGWLRLRSEGNFNASTISSYYTGTTVQIISGSHGWYKVLAPDGKSGWMYGQYLQLGSSGGSSGSTGSAFVTSYNGYGVRLRTGPSTSYRIIRTYPVGTPVTVLERGNNWSRISINGTTGYMMSQFLNFGGSGTGGGGNESILCYATIWSRNGYGVRLRTGPGTGYSKIGVYSVGTNVAVLQKGAVWDLIRVGSRVGWMMNEFLNYHTTNEITSVTLNTDVPVVGSVLSVKAISPSSATVKYSWLVGGVECGTSSTYTVTAADEGKQIQLKVTGTGSYTGSATSALTNKVLSNTILASVKLNTTVPVVGNTLTAAIEPKDATVTYAWKIGGFQVSNAASYTVAANDVGKTIELVVIGNGRFSGMVSAKTSAVVSNAELLGVTITNATNPAATAPTVGDTLTAVLSPAQATATYSWLRNGSPISGATAASYTVTDADVGTTLSVTATATSPYTGAKTSAATTTVLAKPTVPTIDDISLPNGKVDSTYSTQLTAKGGSPYTWALASDSPALPSGLTLSSDGKITGTPTADGSTTFKVVAANSVGKSEAKAFTLTIEPKVVLVPVQSVTVANSTNPTATAPAVGDVLKATLTPADATATYVWLRDGSPIVGATAASYTVTAEDVGKLLSVTVTGTDAYTGNQSASLTAAATASNDAAGNTGNNSTDNSSTPSDSNKPVIPDNTLPVGTVNQEYNATLQASGEGLTWALANNTNLPDGLSLNPDGKITGYPTAVGRTSFEVIATNSDGASDPKEFTITIEAALSSSTLALSIDPSSATVAQGSTQTFQAIVTGSSSATVVWSLAGSNAGSSIDPTSGELKVSDTEQVGTTLTVTATATADGNTATADATVTVDAKPSEINVSIDKPNFTEVTRGQNYSFSATVENDNGSGVNWSVSPDSLSSIDESGNLTVGANETANMLCITATSKADSSKSASVDVNVVSPKITLSIENSPAGSLKPGDTFTFTAQITNSNNGYSWTVEGTPSDPNTMIDATTGTLKIGSNETATSLTVKVTANDDYGVFDSCTVSINTAASTSLESSSQSETSETTETTATDNENP